MRKEIRVKYFKGFRYLFEGLVVFRLKLIDNVTECLGSLRRAYPMPREVPLSKAPFPRATPTILVGEWCVSSP